MNPGVIIEQGPQDWQIIQQENGKAHIRLEGYFIPQDQCGAVYARVVDEETGFPIEPWKAASVSGDKRWEILLRDIPAGGLYRIETCLNEDGALTLEWGFRGDMRHHIGVGDVYVIAGQSNAAGYGKDFVYDPPEPGVHLLRNNGRWDMAAHPFNENTATLHEVNSEGANPGHSPYLAFARRLRKYLGYPVGLIQTSKGGSSLREWDPDTGPLYKNMMTILAAYGPVKGILWYQGCSDTGPGDRDSYLERFKGMVLRLRTDLNKPALPFLTVQIARLTNGDNNHSGWGMIREAQRRAAEQIENVFVVPTTDCTMSDAIHLSASGNLVLAERLAGLALRRIYGKPYGYEAPNIKTACRAGADSIRLSFAPVYNRLYAFEEVPEQLPITVEDQKGQIRVVSYTIEKDTLTLRLERPAGPECTVSGAADTNPPWFTPVDFASHIPILSFYRFPVAN
ncbi:MAG: sialate O-acetylesterase [Treponema sp.]|jgi:hypothetical protein|nr:sialate O-acetylesterase [Treponema sp.]